VVLRQTCRENILVTDQRQDKHNTCNYKEDNGQTPERWKREACDPEQHPPPPWNAVAIYISDHSPPISATKYTSVDSDFSNSRYGPGNYSLILDYFIPIHLPSLLRRPARVSGMPVALAILRLALVTPNARFHENEIPGPSFIIYPPFFGCLVVSLDLALDEVVV